MSEALPAGPWRLAVFAAVWAVLLAALYVSTMEAGGLLLSILVLTVVTWPAGLVAVYAVQAFTTGIGWPAEDPRGLLLVWVVSGAVGFVQWFIAVPALWRRVAARYAGRAAGSGSSQWATNWPVVVGVGIVVAIPAAVVLLTLGFVFFMSVGGGGSLGMVVYPLTMFTVVGAWAGVVAVAHRRSRRRLPDAGSAG